MVIAQLVVNGVLLGGVLALSALGFNIVFAVLSAVFCAVVFAQTNLNPLILLPLTAGAGFVLGALVHRYLLHRLPGEIASAEASSLTLTFGLSFLLAGAGLALFGGNYRSVPFLTGAYQLDGLSFPQ